jgi:hypothetical protein
MARQKNDGKGRIGGRAAGTPNKVNGQVKDWITALLESNREQIEYDLQAMTPQERVKALFGLLGYIVPRQQAISVEDQTKIETEALTAFFNTAPDEAIAAVAAKVVELQQQQLKAQDYGDN